MSLAKIAGGRRFERMHLLGRCGEAGHGGFGGREVEAAETGVGSLALGRVDIG